MNDLRLCVDLHSSTRVLSISNSTATRIMEIQGIKVVSYHGDYEQPRFDDSLDTVFVNSEVV